MRPFTERAAFSEACRPAAPSRWKVVGLAASTAATWRLAPASAQQRGPRPVGSTRELVEAATEQEASRIRVVGRPADVPQVRLRDGQALLGFDRAELRGRDRPQPHTRRHGLRSVARPEAP